MARASYAYGKGDFKDRVLENSHKATTRIDAEVDNVAGVRLLCFNWRLLKAAMPLATVTEVVLAVIVD